MTIQLNNHSAPHKSSAYLTNTKRLYPVYLWTAILCIVMTCTSRYSSEAENRSFIHPGLPLDELTIATDNDAFAQSELALLEESPPYPWKLDIVTTVFWVGETPRANNKTSNASSSWDGAWLGSYGGVDDPAPSTRRGYIPGTFVPQQNPFYCALPYNDVKKGQTKPEASQVIPWFKQAFIKSGQSVCRNRWVAIRKGAKVAYAQWSDCGPFSTDHHEYVFGNERPGPSVNGGAGLDVSPAIRDCLELTTTDVTDWRFVEFDEVPSGPWAQYGDNNEFVLNRRVGTR